MLTAPETSQTPVVCLRGICKQFPGVLANDNIDLDIHPSEIHALLGENGAGKSTLMKILYGFYRSDSGEILINNNPVIIKSPHDARNLNIGMVFQDLNLIPAFSVAENIALFLPDLKAVLNPKKSISVSWKYLSSMICRSTLKKWLLSYQLVNNKKWKFSNCCFRTPEY